MEERLSHFQTFAGAKILGNSARMRWYREGRKMPTAEAGQEAHCRRPRSLRRRLGEKGWSKTRTVESKTCENCEAELRMCGGYAESICSPSQVMQCVGMRTLLALRRKPLSSKDLAKSAQNRRKHGSVERSNENLMQIIYASRAGLTPPRQFQFGIVHKRVRLWGAKFCNFL